MIYTWDQMVRTFKWKSLHRYFVWFIGDSILIDAIPEFDWPTWSVRNRPYDWTIDND